MATNEWNCVEQTISRIITNNSTNMMTTLAPSTSPTSSASATPQPTTLTAMTKAMATTTRITTTSDPGILCFHHCCVKVFCFILPRICPQCKMLLYDVHDNNNDNVNNNNNNDDNNNNSNNTCSNININNTPCTTTITKSNHTNTNRRTNELKDIINNGYVVQEQLNQQQEQQSHSTDINKATLLLNNRLLPFRLPYPFIRASQYPCAIILRPTVGDFLNDYNNTTDLHIAVTTSTGCVVEFDRHGLRRRRTDHMPEWWQCLLVGDVPEPWYDYWDQILLQVCQRPNKWTIAQYHKDKYNCYTFVLNFLQELSYDKLSEAANSRTTFCEKYIVPRTTTAGKYISLYRKLRVTGIYVHQIVQYNNSYNNNHNNNNNNKNHSDSKSINRQHYTNNNTIPSMQYKIKGNNININSQHNSSNNNTNNNNVNCNATTPNYYNGNSNGNDSGNNVSGNGAAGAIGNCLIIRPHTTLCTIEE